MWPNPQFPADFVILLKKFLMENFFVQYASWKILCYFYRIWKVYEKKCNQLINLYSGKNTSLSFSLTFA